MGTSNIVEKLLSNFTTKDKKSQSILFYSTSSYISNNNIIFRDIMLHFLQNIYCEEKENTNKNCGKCKNCKLIETLTHPDIKIVTPTANGIDTTKILNNFFLNNEQEQQDLNFEGKQLIINKEQITEVQDFVNASSPNIGKYKTVVFWMPEYMNAISMNLLLKTIEEPPADTIFLFLSENKDILLPTVLSRTMCFFIKNKEKHIFKTNEDFNTFVDWMRLCYTKKYVKLVPFVDEFSKRDKESQKQFFLFLGFIFEQLWLSSLRMYTLMQIHGTDLETINKMSNLFSTDSIYLLYEKINKSIPYLKRNVNTKLLLMDLSIEIHNAIKTIK